MIILSLRTDKPEAEIGIYNDVHQQAYLQWQAHRQLAETIHTQIQELLRQNQLTLADIQGIAAYKGPGSFTGLRIGLTVANALAASLQIPIVSESGDDWQALAVSRLTRGDNEQLALPEYGALPHITQPKK